MVTFLAHLAILGICSWAAATHLYRNRIDRALAASLLAWVNIVGTSLLLSWLTQLGNPVWFFRTSLLLAVLTWIAVRGRISPSAADPVALTSGGKRRWGWMLLASLVPFAAGALLTCFLYPPNNYDSLTYHLPRCVFYLGQGSLAHFPTYNSRQVFFPFNHTLLYVVPLVYGAPAAVLTFFNVAAWIGAGLAIFRFCRLSGRTFNGACFAVWIALMATQVIAQASSTTNDLPTAAALIASSVFVIRWTFGHLRRDTYLAGIGFGLTIGSKLTMVYFGPAGIVILGLLVFRLWRQGTLRVEWARMRSWLVPIAIAVVLVAPFIIFNLSARGEWMTTEYDYARNKPFSLTGGAQTGATYLLQFFVEPLHRFTFDLERTTQLNQWFINTFFKHWNPAHAFSELYIFPPDLNEDHVWFGFAGPFALLCALVVVVFPRKWYRPEGLAALAGFGWLAAFFLLNKWSLYNQRYFIAAYFAFTPSVALLWDAVPKWSWWRRSLGILVALAVIFTSCWFGAHYQFANTSRPLRPLLTSATARPVSPPVPPLLLERLRNEPFINSRFRGGNERTFLFMGHRPDQRFLASDHEDPQAYNLHSFWGVACNTVMLNSSQFYAYALIAVPGKTTAGAEPLGRIDSGVNNRHYIGVQPADRPAVPPNNHVLVVVNHGAYAPHRFSDLKIEVIGLNPADNLRLAARSTLGGELVQELLNSTTSGQFRIAATEPFDKITITLFAPDSVEPIATGEIALRTITDSTFAYLEADSDHLFAYEAVIPERAGPLEISGLASPEGPYAEFDLPRFRWAKKPVVRLVLNDPLGARRLKLSFSARLQVREEGRLEVYASGKLLDTLDFDGKHTWIEKTLEFPAEGGPTTIELRDIPLAGQAPAPESLYFVYRTLRVEGMPAQ